jgi:calcineurin-like phosphoesterase family protein
MSTLDDLILSCWIVEAARSSVLTQRGHHDAGARSAERARILASRCAAEGVKIRPEFASEHARWMGGVSGSAEETGALGWFFLQRLGSYVDAHAGDLLDEDARKKFVELGTQDAEEVNAAVGSGGLPPSPPPEWPAAPRAQAPGKVHARIGILGDPHVGMRVSDEIVPMAVADMNGRDLSMVVVPGDLTQNGKAEHFERARTFFEKIEAPWIVTLGNHDMFGGGTEFAVGLPRFKAAFEREPFAMMEKDGVRVITIHTADPTPSPFPPFDLVTASFTDEPNESVPGGTIAPNVAEWMAAIEPGGPTFVFLHHEPYPYLGFPPLLFGLDEPSTKVLEEFVTRVGAEAVFCGHTHRCARREFAGVPLVEVPCPKEWPFAYATIEVSDEGWAYNLEPIRAGGAGELVEKESEHFGLLFRRYSRGPEEARSFVRTRP